MSSPAGQEPFHVLIPARLASTRLPNKPLADLAGVPMVVRVAQRSLLSGAESVTVAADDERIAQACREWNIPCVLTRAEHPSGSDRLAEACEKLGLPQETIVVNVQGDEPLIDPVLIQRCASTLAAAPDCVMATVAHTLESEADLANPNVVKVVLDAQQRALLFSRAPIPYWRDRDSNQGAHQGPVAALRHVGLYAYRVGFLRAFPELAASPLERCEMLEQLRVLWHGHRIAVHVCDEAPAAGVDTPEDLQRVRALLQSQP